MHHFQAIHIGPVWLPLNLAFFGGSGTCYRTVYFINALTRPLWTVFLQHCFMAPHGRKHNKPNNQVDHTFNSVNFSVIQVKQFLWPRPSLHLPSAGGTRENLVVSEDFPHQLPDQLRAIGAGLLTTSGIEQTRDKDARAGNQFHSTFLHLLITQNNHNTIQYNTKFVKRHVAVASEALANKTVKKHRRRRTDVL